MREPSTGLARDNVTSIHNSVRRSVRRAAWCSRHAKENMIATTRARRLSKSAAPASASLLPAPANAPSGLVSPLIQTLAESDETFAFNPRSVWLVCERSGEYVQIVAISGDAAGARRIAAKNNVGRAVGDDAYWHTEPHPLNIRKLVL